VHCVYAEDCVKGVWGQRIVSLFPFKWYERSPLDLCFNFSSLERGLVPLKQATVPSWELGISSQLCILSHMHIS